MKDTDLKIKLILSRIVKNESNLIDEVREFNELRALLENSFDEKFHVFITFGSETDDFPRGEVRKKWNSESLKDIDLEADKVIREYEKDLLAAAVNLLEGIQ